jgi:hypothetical protein
LTRPDLSRFYPPWDTNVSSPAAANQHACFHDSVPAYPVHRSLLPSYRREDASSAAPNAKSCPLPCCLLPITPPVSIVVWRKGSLLWLGSFLVSPFPSRQNEERLSLLLFSCRLGPTKSFHPPRPESREPLRDRSYHF